MAQLDEAWQPWTAVLRNVRLALVKPILFTEVGVRSIADAYQQPMSYYFDEGISVPVNERDQSNYFLSFCHEPMKLLAGTYVWRANIYTLAITGTPEEPVSFSPLNKLAEGAIKDCYAHVARR